MCLTAINSDMRDGKSCLRTGLEILFSLLFMTAYELVWAAAGNGDPVRGEIIYGRCAACHSLNYNRTGPLHCGIVGRMAGTVSGFGYSVAMQNANIVWNSETLDLFLESPIAMVPGTTMGYAGINDSRDRHDLIAYLEYAGHSAELCGSNLSTEKP